MIWIAIIQTLLTNPINQQDLGQLLLIIRNAINSFKGKAFSGEKVKMIWQILSEQCRLKKIDPVV